MLAKLPKLFLSLMYEPKSDAPRCSSLSSLTLKQVNESVLKKVIEWCEHHKGDPPAAADDDSDSRKKSTDIDEWDQKFMQVDQEMLFEIILVRITLFCFVVNCFLALNQ